MEIRLNIPQSVEWWVSPTTLVGWGSLTPATLGHARGCQSGDEKAEKGAW